MTTQLSQTTANEFAKYDPNTLPMVFGKLGLAALLANIGTPEEETLAVDATFKCTLAKLPMRGTVLAARKTGSYLKQEEVHAACTLAQGQYQVDYTTGEVTFETTDFNDTDEAVFTYVAVDTLVADLAADFAT